MQGLGDSILCFCFLLSFEIEMGFLCFGAFFSFAWGECIFERNAEGGVLYISVGKARSAPCLHRTGNICTAIVRSIWRFYVHFYFWQAFPRRICPARGASPVKASPKQGGKSMERAFFGYFLPLVVKSYSPQAKLDGSIEKVGFFALLRMTDGGGTDCGSSPQ
jgi:hypothetical protein